MVITHKFWVDADLSAVSCAFEEIWVSAGQASIGRLSARLSAVVRIPVVGVVVFLHDVVKSITEVIFLKGSNIIFSRADHFVVHINIFFFRASLIYSEYTV